MKKRIVALILCLVMLFSTSAVQVNAGLVDNKCGIINTINTIENGYPMTNLGNVLKGIYQIRMFINNLLGFEIFADEKICVVVDDTIQSVIDDIAFRTGVDVSEIYTNVPAIDRGAEIITSALRINIPEFQDFLGKVAEEFFAKGNPTMGTITRLIRVWFGLVDEFRIRLVPVEERPGVSRFYCDIVYYDGRVESVKSSIVYDENIGEIVDISGNPALLGFNFDVNKAMSYTGVNVWQRTFGFCIEYDIFCFLTPYLMNYTTQRIKFNYDNREWMCQIWKGKYIITNGGEVGFYNRPMGSVGTFYNCVGDEDMLTMSLDIYHKDKLILSRSPIKHWWVTGFALDDVCYVPETLTLVSTITMKDEEMLDAFTKALKKKWYAIKFKTDGLNVTIEW